MPGRIRPVELGVNPFTESKQECLEVGQCCDIISDASTGSKQIRHTMNLHPFLPVFHARSNSTRGIEFDPPLKMGGNHWDDTQFDQGGIQM